jgi:hypothetical protein
VGLRPNLEGLVGNCLMAWPSVEAEMALALGQILGAQHNAIIAVFPIIRRFATQQSIIQEAAKASLNPTDQELTIAILNVHKSAEAERTALAHGHFGATDTIPDGLVWMHTTDYLAVRTLFTLKGDLTIDDNRLKEIASKLWVYKEHDLTTILADFQALAWIWHDLIIYLKSSNSERSQLYQQLCDRPRVKRELLLLRKNTS